MAKQRMAYVLSALIVTMGLGMSAPAVFASSSADDINTRIANGETQITLENDVVGNIVVGAGKTVTISLGGHSITGTSGATITNEGTLTIAGEGDVISVDAYAVDNHGVMTIAGGNYSTTVPVNYVNGQLTGSAPSLVRNGWDGPTTDEFANMTISGGTFVGGLNNVKNDEHGILSITGGSFTNNDGQNVILNGGKSLSITGGTFVAPNDIYHFGLQNQSFGADAEKIVVVEGVTLPSFGFSKTVGDSVYTVDVRNTTIGQFPTNTPMSTNCASMRFDHVTSEKGMTFSTACSTVITDSTFGSGLVLNKLGSVEEIPVIEVTNTKIAGNFKVNGPIVTANNCENTMLEKTDGTPYRSGYNTVSRSGSKLTVNGGTWGYGGNSAKKAFMVSNYGELILNDGAEVEGAISIETSGGKVTINNATIAEGINMTTKFGGDVTVYEGIINGGINAAAAAVNAEADNYVLLGGVYDVRPDDKYIPDNFEPDDNEAGEGFAIYPKVVDWSQHGGGYIKTNSNDENQVSATLEIGEYLPADRKATLSVVEVSLDSLTLDAIKGGELIGAVDINMLDRTPAVIDVKDNSLVIWFDIDEDTYNMLSSYDKLYAVYFDENGVEVERYEITLENEGFWFETSHLSTYGVVGVNNEEPSTGEASASTPDTGTVTAAGASAMSAAIITAVAVGLLTSIISFAYLIRKL